MDPFLWGLGAILGWEYLCLVKVRNELTPAEGGDEYYGLAEEGLPPPDSIGTTTGRSQIG